MEATASMAGTLGAFPALLLPPAVEYKRCLMFEEVTKRLFLRNAVRNI
jgi:hypothetical protein